MESYFVAYNGIVQTLYVAYYGRPADAPGYDYWSRQLDGADPATILEPFSRSAEFRERFDSLSDPDLVDGLYQQLFNRAADPSGLDYYTGALASGEWNLAEIALRIANGARNTDSAILDNKLTAAARFTETVWDDNSVSVNTEVDASTTARYLQTIGEAEPPQPEATPAILADLERQTLTLEEALAAEQRPALYEVDSQSDYQIDSPLDVQRAAGLLNEAEEVIASATNSDELSLDSLLNWSLADEADALTAVAEDPVLTGADSHELTDSAGADLGFLPDSAYEVVMDASNTTDYLFRPEMDGDNGRLWPIEGTTSPLVVQIESTFNNNGQLYQSQGSGVLIGPNNVLTAAHVVHMPESEGGWAQSVSVAPGYDQGRTPYGRFDAVDGYGYPVDTYGGRISLEQSTYDMTVLHLEEALGYQYGYMDIGLDSMSGNVVASGYPGTAGGAQVNSDAIISAREANESIGGRSYYLYEADAQSPGSSGGPLWGFDDGVATVAGNISTTDWAYDVSNDSAVIEEQIIGSNTLIDQSSLEIG